MSRFARKYQSIQLVNRQTPKTESLVGSSSFPCNTPKEEWICKSNSLILGYVHLMWKFRKFNGLN